MDWRLRRAVAGDEGALALVAGATFLQTFAGILDGADIVSHISRNSGIHTFGRWLHDGDTDLWLAEAATGAAPIGYAVTTRPDLPVEPRDGDRELKRIYLLAGVHGTGLAAALMDAAIDASRARGASRLLLGVYGNNRRAQRFYEKQGFTVIGTRRFQVGAAIHDDLVFARSL